MITTNFWDIFGNRVNSGQYFFGGGKVNPPKEKPVKIPETPAVQMPEPPPPAPPTPPPPSASNMDAMQSAQDQKQQAARRKGVRSTLVAGETTGPLSSSQGATRKTLLG